MDSILSVMQQVAARETEKIYTTELGIVTAIFPHETESDKNNYQCSVNLKNRKKGNGSDFELRQVPLTTGHIGTVNIPNVGDLVVVAFINGDLNAPVIIGRLYNDEQVPPLSKKDELVVEDIEVIKIKMKGGETTLEIDKEGNLKIVAKGTISINETQMTLKPDGDIAIHEDKIVIKKDGNISINKDQVIIKPNGDISINKDQVMIKKGGEININKGKNGAAREDDTVEVTIPPGTFLIAAQAGIPNSAPVKVTGKITSSSGTVKIGG